ncbi:MAG: GmrSD restriction endonuclease domain-containing protein [Armatimonadota bacterium]
MKISTVLDQIDLGAVALPEFQRGYVWNREQVRGLMYSLYRKHPVGSLLVWVTKTEQADARGDGNLAPGSVKLLLDGQQRMSSLYGIIKGCPPKFFDGNDQAFTGLHFNLADETFEFYAPVKMKDNPLWVSVTECLQLGAGKAIQKIIQVVELQANLPTYINRLTALDQIKEIELHIEEVAGSDKTVDVVVDIFNRVNSGGTKLSKGDLALARICAQWPDARDEMKSRLKRWHNAGFSFRLEWFLRSINSVMTGEALFSALKDVETPAFQKGMVQAEKAIDGLLNMISSRLGLDHDRVLGSKGSFPLMARYVAECGGHISNHQQRDKLLYWYIHTILWGRYAGSTESILNQDLSLIENIDGCLDRLIEQLRRNRGDLRVQPDDFLGWSQGARFYPLLYMLTRVCHSKDFLTGVELSNMILGSLSRLELHHIFPKAFLYKHGYSRSEVNALANFTFLTQETNVLLSDRSPENYLMEVSKNNPGALESHWIPTDERLWKPENYAEFLAARRELLAGAANRFLDSLLEGSIPESVQEPSILDRIVDVVPGSVDTEDEESIILDCLDWVIKQGLSEGEMLYELTDPDTGNPLAIIDIAWPNGLQEGLSEPVALLIDEDSDVEEIVNAAGYRFYTTVDDFKAYVRRAIFGDNLLDIGAQQP